MRKMLLLRIRFLYSTLKMVRKHVLNAAIFIKLNRDSVCADFVRYFTYFEVIDTLYFVLNFFSSKFGFVFFTYETETHVCKILQP